MLIGAKDKDDLLSQMCQIAVEEGGYLLAWYGRKLHDDKRSIAVVASSTGHESYLDDLEVHWRDDDLGQGTAGRAARSCETCTSSDIDSDSSMAPWRDRARQHGFRSAVSIPVMIDGELDGVWQVYAMEPRAFTPEVLAVLEDIASEIAYGLSRLAPSTK
jgi:GAF domain-containing protein